jgi:hypothetical protein
VVPAVRPRCCNSADGYRSLNDGDVVEYTVGSGGGPNCAYPRHRGRRGGASSSILPPTLEEPEVFFGRRLWSGVEPEAAPVPLPRVLSHAHQTLHETKAAILREWEALEAEHQRLSDWRTQLEERTKVASRQFASERSELEQDHKDYKKDLQKVYARVLEVSRKEKMLAKREEALNHREEVVTELRDKLSAMDKILEEQRIQHTVAVERLQKLQQELEGKARDAALAEEKLKAKGESLHRRETDLARRETDLARREKDLAFKEEMLERQEKFLAEHELEAEEKERTLEERVRQFEAARAAPGPQVAEAAKKALEDLQAEHRTGVQRIAEWAGEASKALVPPGISPIPVSGPLESISDALPMLDSAAKRLRRLDQILSARLEPEDSRLCRAVVDYVLTCFRGYDPAMSLALVLDGPVAATEDTARESIQDAVEMAAARFQHDPVDAE